MKIVMKYRDYEVNPKNAEAKSWKIHKKNNLTIIFPRADAYTLSDYSIIYHKHQKERIILLSPFNIAQHGQLLDVLFKYLKLPTTTNHLDCIMGIKFSDATFSWGKTKENNPNSPIATNIHEIMDLKRKNNKIITAYLETIINNYIERFKKTKNSRFEITEILPKIRNKRPAKRIAQTKPKIIKRINRI